MSKINEYMNMDLFKRADWIATTNIYEVNIRQYTPEGSFSAFAKNLPRLKDMGVEVLWLMPIHPIGKINRKGSLGSYYSISDFKGVNPEFGTPADLKKLVGLAHESGMKVIMDWVANHAAWDNIWTTDHPEYFARDPDGHFIPPYDWTDVIQIDHTNTGQQDAMIDAMTYWVTEFDIDGFRADLAHLTPLDFWKKARTAIEPLKSDLFWLAESEEIGYHEVFDATFTWEWMHITENFYKGNVGISALYEVLAGYRTGFPEQAHRMYFTSNHDENTWNGTGNEKYGDMLKALVVFSCTWNGMPMIYSGEELPNAKRLPFFEKDPISWANTCELHDFYKTLLFLKKTNSALRSADPAVSTFHVLTEGSKNMMAFLRKNEQHEVLVFLNLGNKPVGFLIKDRLIGGDYHNVFEKTTDQLSEDSFLKMKPWHFLVYERKK
ncbi:MAG: 1,4-alpha-glucan branching protein [Chitinophagaceae bacterium]|nr:1,4-alpha-glucan branching protein [Chitinophagaceae bacterium]